MKVRFVTGKDTVKAANFTFTLHCIPTCENRAETYSLICKKHGEDNILYTDWSHRFHTREEAGQFCEKILSGELNFKTLCEEAKLCKDRETKAMLALRKAKLENSVKNFLATAQTRAAPEDLYEILWEFSQLPASAADTVLKRLTSEYNILPHVKLTLPQCDHCGHYIDQTRMCCACDGVLDMSKTYGPEYHAPKERVKDIGCKKFSLDWQGSYEYQQRLTVWFYPGQDTAPVELGDVLVSKELDVQNAKVQEAIKQQVILDKLFDNADLHSMAMEDFKTAVNALKLDIWYWCHEEERERSVFHG